MGNEFARKNMWESDYRPEQLFTRDFLSELHPEWVIKTEYPIDRLTLDGKPWRPCRLDIAIIDIKMAIRLNGGYHFSSGVQRNKDEYQKEALKQAGWHVFDFDSHMMPNLFKKKKSEETVKLAQEEILKQLERDTFWKNQPR